MFTRSRRRSLKLSSNRESNRVERPRCGYQFTAIIAAAFVLLTGPAEADIVNSSLAKGRIAGQDIFSRPALGSVPLAQQVASFSLEYSGSFADAGADAGNSAGDKIDLLLKATNTGNLSLYGATLRNDVVTLVLADGDEDGDRILDVGETWQFRAEYVLTQTDLDSDLPQDALLFHASLAFDRMAAREATAAVPVRKVPRLEIAAHLVELSSPQPYEFVAGIQIDATNRGNVTLTDLGLTADFAATSAEVQQARIESVTGFRTSQNQAFGSGGEVELLAPGAMLAPGKSGSVRLLATARANPPEGQVALTMSGTSPRLGDPSKGAFETLLLPLSDSDGDGAPDAIESVSDDRDGDGIADAFDYDPTGYFYCESDGRILTGGKVAVERLGPNDTDQQHDRSGSIHLLRDGSDGTYQFHVSESGLYSLSYELPENVRPSSRLPAAGVPGRPGNAIWVLGAGELADSGVISDRSAEANPYRLEFELQPGKPVIFNNNIPSALCGMPALETTIAVSDGPIVLRSGRTRLAYRITVENTGSETLEGLRIDNNLADVFGAGGFEIETVLLESVPPQFSAEANPFFDGASDTGLLTSGGELRPGEKVTLIQVVAFRAAGGEYVNRVLASGVSTVDLKPVDESTASTEIAVAGNTGPAELEAGIVADKHSLAAGQEMQVALSITNPQSVNRSGVDIVSRLPEGISYIAGSAQIDGTSVEPVLEGNEVLWPDRSIPSGGTVTVDAKVSVDEEAGRSDATLQLIARETGSGRILSSPARMTVALPGSDDSCIGATGTVFSDTNLDGIRQPHEAGVAGVRVRFGDDTSVLSDENGQYEVSCGFFEALGPAREISVRVDPLSLLADFDSSVSPQSAAVSADSRHLPDFALRPAADISLRLDERNFEPGSATMTRETLAQLSQLLREFPGGDAKARITYASPSGDSLADQRLDLAAQLMVEAWSLIHGGSGLNVETEITRKE
jgi:hypothetical protein